MAVERRNQLENSSHHNLWPELVRLVVARAGMLEVVVGELLVGEQGERLAAVQEALLGVVVEELL